MKSIAYLTFATTIFMLIAALAPNFVATVVGLPPSDIGYLVAPAGIGVIVGVVIVPRLVSRFRRDALIDWAVVVGGLSLLLLSLSREILSRVLAPEAVPQMLEVGAGRHAGGRPRRLQRAGAGAVADDLAGAVPRTYPGPGLRHVFHHHQRCLVHPDLLCGGRGRPLRRGDGAGRRWPSCSSRSERPAWSAPSRRIGSDMSGCEPVIARVPRQSLRWAELNRPSSRVLWRARAQDEVLAERSFVVGFERWRMQEARDPGHVIVREELGGVLVQESGGDENVEPLAADRAARRRRCGRGLRGSRHVRLIRAGSGCCRRSRPGERPASGPDRARFGAASAGVLNLHSVLRSGGRQSSTIFCTESDASVSPGNNEPRQLARLCDLRGLDVPGEPRRTRTFNQLIKSQLLCQLS